MSTQTTHRPVSGQLSIGTWLQGYITTTRRTLTRVLGEPGFMREPDGDLDKVSVEWTVQFSDGTVATVYDWKRYELGIPGEDEVEVWNIGGVSPAAADLVEMAVQGRSKLEG